MSVNDTDREGEGQDTSWTQDRTTKNRKTSNLRPISVKSVKSCYLLLYTRRHPERVSHSTSVHFLRHGRSKKGVACGFHYTGEHETQQCEHGSPNPPRTRAAPVLGRKNTSGSFGDTASAFASPSTLQRYPSEEGRAPRLLRSRPRAPSALFPCLPLLRCCAVPKRRQKKADPQVTKNELWMGGGIDTPMRTPSVFVFFRFFVDFSTLCSFSSIVSRICFPALFEFCCDGTAAARHTCGYRVGEHQESVTDSDTGYGSRRRCNCS